MYLSSVVFCCSVSATVAAAIVMVILLLSLIIHRIDTNGQLESRGNLDNSDLSGKWL